MNPNPKLRLNTDSKIINGELMISRNVLLACLQARIEVRSNRDQTIELSRLKNDLEELEI